MTKDLKTSLLNPALQAALNSLDLDLEQEIFRYKRRRGIQRASDRGLLTLGASPNTELAATRTPNRPPDEMPRLQPSLHPQDRMLRESGGGLARTETVDAPPGDYLASSEQLLRSLAAEEPKSLRQGRRSNWLNPLGIAALLLMLIAGGALAYVLNPNLWTELVQGKKETPVAQGNSAIATNSSPDRPAVSAPNLAANSSFTDLNLQNLSALTTNPNLYPKPSSTVSAPPVKNPTVNSLPGTQNPQNLVSALIPSTQNPKKSQQPIVVRSQAAAGSTLPKLGRPLPNGRVYYYVLTDYANNNSLVRGRGIARDAFVVQAPTGKKVQIAAFTRQVDADALVKKLQNRGISAQVFLD